AADVIRVRSRARAVHHSRLQSASPKNAVRHQRFGSMAGFPTGRTTMATPGVPAVPTRRRTPYRGSSALVALGSGLLATIASAATGTPPEPPAIVGVPIDFILFAATLLGVALFQRHTLKV